MLRFVVVATGLILAAWWLSTRSLGAKHSWPALSAITQRVPKSAHTRHPHVSEANLYPHTVAVPSKYVDSDFGFSFSLPGPISDQRFIAQIYGRCARMQSGDLDIVGCGDMFAVPIRGATVANLQGAYEHWLSNVAFMHGLVQQTQFGNDWFVSRAIQPPSMVAGPEPILSFHKEFVGDILGNSVWIRIPVSHEERDSRAVEQVLNSFRPGELNALPPPERRADWDPYRQPATR